MQTAPTTREPFRYRRHEPEKTQLYRTLAREWETWHAERQADTSRLPLLGCAFDDTRCDDLQRRCDGAAIGEAECRAQVDRKDTCASLAVGLSRLSC